MARAAHDLRTPLTSMRLIADALHDGLLPDPGVRRAYLESLQANIARMTDLVEAAFEASQLDAGDVTLRREPVRLGDLVLDLLLRFEPHATAVGVHLQADIAEAAITVHGDRSRISGILDNLAQNAIRHTPPGSTVRVTVEADSSTARVRVRDACGGMSDNELDRIFDRRRRGAAAGATAGSGLGLAIASTFAHLHGGRLVAVNSEPGCEVRLEVPLHRGP